MYGFLVPSYALFIIGLCCALSSGFHSISFDFEKAPEFGSVRESCPSDLCPLGHQPPPDIGSQRCVSWCSRDLVIVYGRIRRWFCWFSFRSIM
jgi:hypothetical protein